MKATIGIQSPGFVEFRFRNHQDDIVRCLRIDAAKSSVCQLAERKLADGSRVTFLPGERKKPDYQGYHVARGIRPETGRTT